MTKRELHLFDFDGTITSKDSLIDFAVFVVGPMRSKLYLMLVTPVIFLMKAGVLKRANAKVMFLKLHFRGMKRSDLKMYAEKYAAQAEPSGLYRPLAMQTIARLKEDGQEICIVSASLDVWLESLAENLGLNLICTKGLFTNDRFTGELVGKNCNFNEKARRIRAEYNLAEFSRVVAYGDSSGDKAMFELADESHMRPFE